MHEQGGANKNEQNSNFGMDRHIETYRDGAHIKIAIFVINLTLINVAMRNIWIRMIIVIIVFSTNEESLDNQSPA